MSTIRSIFAAISITAALCLAAPAFAAGSSDSPPAKAESDYDKAVKAVKAEKFKDAIDLLQRVTSKDPKNADAWNYLGYSQRKTGQLDPALASYTRALEIDPKHKGAHEYVGELYLMRDNLAKAEEHLKVLAGLCSSCEERRDLEKAVAAYKKAKGIS